MTKQRMVVYAARMDEKTKDWLQASGKGAELIRYALDFCYPDINKPPVIVITKAEPVGFYAAGEDYDGAEDSDCILAWGKTEKIAKEGFLEKWREQHG